MTTRSLHSRPFVIGAPVLTVLFPLILFMSLLFLFSSPLSAQSFVRGDANNDGYADLIVGASLDDNKGRQSGSARLFSGIDGKVLYTFNGDSAGDVFGQTVNGGLHIELDGASWDGEALDVKTTNGGIDLEIPEHYGAELITGTVNGQLRTDLPIDIPTTAGGRKAKRLETMLNGGGPMIKLVTTNGGVSISER